MYKINFLDKTTFESTDNILENGWNDMPNKQILSIEYTMGDNTVLMTKFEGYNHIVEKTRIVNKRTGKDVQFVSQIVLMGLHQGMVYKISWDFIKKSVIQEKCKEGQEFNGRETTGWKAGVFSETPNIKLL